MSLETFLSVLIIGSMVVILPGPNFAITLKNSLLYSRKAGICTVLGIGSGSLIHITYCLLGIGVIISRSIELFNTLKLLGAFYLAFLGVKALLAKKTENADVVTNGEIGFKNAFYTGILTDLLNPKTTLFFLALFTQIIHPGTPIAAQLVYGLTVVGMKVIWYSAVCVLISKDICRIYMQRFLHIIEKVTGVLLIGFGIRLAFTSNK